MREPDAIAVESVKRQIRVPDAARFARVMLTNRFGELPDDAEGMSAPFAPARTSCSRCPR